MYIKFGIFWKKKKKKKIGVKAQVFLKLLTINSERRAYLDA